MRVLGVNAIFHDPSAALVVDGDGRRRRRGGAVLAAQARQAAGAVLGVGAARAGHALVPRGGGAAPAGPRRRGLLVRPRRWPSRPRTSAWTTRGTPCAACTPRRPRASSRRPCPAWTASRCGSCPHHVAHAASAALAAPLDGAGRPCSVLVLDGRGEQASHLAGPLRGRPARGARRAGAAALARPALRVAHRAPGLPPLQRRVQGHGAGVLRAARCTSRPCARRSARRRDGGFEAPLPDWSRFAPRRSGGEDDWPPLLRRPRVLGAGPARGAARRARDVAARPHRRPGADDGRAAPPSTAWRTAGSGGRRPSRRSGCSRPPATPAPRSAPRCRCTPTAATRPSR